MSRGHPDWLVSTDYYSHVDSDDAELAVRLGSPYRYNRSGKVIGIEQQGVKLAQWNTGGSGTGNAIVEDTDCAFIGDRCLKLTPGSDVNKFAYMWRSFPRIRHGFYAMEYLFWLTDEDIDIVSRFQLQTDKNYYIFQVKLDGGTKVLSYLNSAGGYTAITTLTYPLENTTPVWHYIRLLIDTINKKYVEVQVNDEVFSLGQLVGTSGASLTVEHFQTTITTYDLSGSKNPAYVDAFIVTLDSP